ncbi:MAG: MFS transporter [Psychromonas sp.]
MFLLLRAWFGMSCLIVIILLLISTMTLLQHNALLSDLQQKKINVVVHSVATSFQTVVNLGLPLSMMRNGNDVLDRARALDPAIKKIHVFNSSGFITHTSGPQTETKVSKKIIEMQKLNQDPSWGMETEQWFISGISVYNPQHDQIGGIVAYFPKNQYQVLTDTVKHELFMTTFILIIIFCLLSLLILRFLLNETMQISPSMKRWLQPNNTLPLPEDRPKGMLEGEMHTLFGFLKEADYQYCQLKKLVSKDSSAKEKDLEKASEQELISMVSIPEMSVARAFSKQLLPWNVALILCASLILGWLNYQTVNRSVEPELEQRTSLIAKVANHDLQRALSAGVPLAKIVGLEAYFSELLHYFPEISYFGVASGEVLFEAGDWKRSFLRNKTADSKLPIYPLTFEDEVAGYVIIDPNQNFLALQFRSIWLDLLVVITVGLLLANEFMVVLMSLSLTASLNRLQHLAALQAEGDFTAQISKKGNNVIEQLIVMLSLRSQEIQSAFHQGMFTLTNSVASSQAKLIDKLSQPKRLRFTYLNDIRLPLFLFAAADEMPLSFFHLFVRSTEKQLTFLDPAVAISLPLAGYLLAFMIAAPFSRTLSERWGHRSVLFISLLTVFLSNAGIYFADSVTEIIFYRTFAGGGYGIAVLVCQDYVLDAVPKKQRVKSMGVFSATLFGGIFSGTAIGGVIADRFGNSSVFLVCAALVLFSALLFHWMMPVGKHQARDKAIPITIASMLRPLKHKPFFIVVFGLAIPQSIMDQVFISYLFSLHLDAIGTSIADIGRILMVYFIMIVIAGSFLVWLSSKSISNTVIVVLGSMLSGGTLLLGSVLGSPWAMLLAAAGTGLGYGLVRGITIDLVMQQAENDLKYMGSSVVMGAMRLWERAASVIGLIVIALISSMLGLTNAIASVGVIIIIGAVYFALNKSIIKNVGEEEDKVNIK